MSLEPLTPDNTTVVLIDYAVGFANLLRSHDVAEHVTNAVGLATTAKLYGAELVVTNGAPGHPAGPLYPELIEAIGEDQKVIERKSAFNAFLDEEFKAAVEAAGNRRLVIGGIATDGCVLQSVLGALRLGYAPHVVVDAVASPSKEAHEVAIQRMTLAGAVPVTWWSLAAEFQLEPRFADKPFRNQLMARFNPAMRLAGQSYFAGVAQGKAAGGPTTASGPASAA